MMKPWSVFIVASCAGLVLAGCSGSDHEVRASVKDQIKSTLASWVGMPETMLIDQLGTPDTQERSGEKMFYEYKTCDTAQALGKPRSKEGLDCYLWTFEIKDGRIVNDHFAPYKK